MEYACQHFCHIRLAKASQRPVQNQSRGIPQSSKANTRKLIIGDIKKKKKTYHTYSRSGGPHWRCLPDQLHRCKDADWCFATLIYIPPCMTQMPTFLDWLDEIIEAQGKPSSVEGHKSQCCQKTAQRRDPVINSHCCNTSGSSQKLFSKSDHRRSVVVMLLPRF
jgi:hypothetical protein